MGPEIPTDGRSSPEEYDDESKLAYTTPEIQWAPCGQRHSDRPTSP